MLDDKENDCPCPNTSCPRRGDCIACFDAHTTKEKREMCRRPEIMCAPEVLARVDKRLRAAGRIQ